MAYHLSSYSWCFRHFFRLNPVLRTSVWVPWSITERLPLFPPSSTLPRRSASPRFHDGLPRCTREPCRTSPKLKRPIAPGTFPSCTSARCTTSRAASTSSLPRACSRPSGYRGLYGAPSSLHSVLYFPTALRLSHGSMTDCLVAGENRAVLRLCSCSPSLPARFFPASRRAALLHRLPLRLLFPVLPTSVRELWPLRSAFLTPYFLFLPVVLRFCPQFLVGLPQSRTLLRLFRGDGG